LALRDGGRGVDAAAWQEIDLDVAAAQKNLPWWRDHRPDLYKHLV
jgi:hypothetical protein